MVRNRKRKETMGQFVGSVVLLQSREEGEADARAKAL